jgi:hypothetical protein
VKIKNMIFNFYIITMYDIYIYIYIYIKKKLDMFHFPDME